LLVRDNPKLRNGSPPPGRRLAAAETLIEGSRPGG
jgi:hypothetical protein